MNQRFPIRLLYEKRRETTHVKWVDTLRNTLFVCVTNMINGIEEDQGIFEIKLNKKKNMSVESEERKFIQQ